MIEKMVSRGIKMGEMNYTRWQWMIFMMNAGLIVSLSFYISWIDSPIQWMSALGFPYFLYSSGYLFRYYELRNRKYGNIDEMMSRMVDRPLNKGEVYSDSFYIHSIRYVQAYNVDIIIEAETVHVKCKPLFTSHHMNQKVINVLEENIHRYLKKNKKHKMKHLLNEYEVNLSAFKYRAS
jgi:hypothetical protein